MGIVLARIDNRFVHGQILEGWVPFTRATAILVANDEVAKNEVVRMAMESSIPRGLTLHIMEVEDAASRLIKGELDKGRIILLFGNTKDALRATELGLMIEEINIGNIHFCPGKFQISPSVSVDKMDLDNLKALTDRGTRVLIRCVPSDPPRSIWDVVKKE